MRRILLYIFMTAALLSLFSCSGSRSGSDAQSEAQSLIEAASNDISVQRFDAAMEKALHALDLADAENSPLLKVRALNCITGIDIMASRDADAWEKALEAEVLARENGFKEELSSILISKAKLCSYAEI